MIEQNNNYRYRGKPLVVGGENLEGGSRRMLIVFMAVCSVFVFAMLGLYLWSKWHRPAAPTAEAEAATGTQPTPAEVAAAAARRADPVLGQRCAAAAALLAEGKFVEAAAAARATLAGLSEDNPLWEQAAQTLGEANLQLFISDIPAPGCKVLYVVKAGDALDRIARHHDTTLEAIQRANRLDPANHTIRIGQSLVLYQGKWSIKVSKARFRLYLYDAPERLFKVYSVGIGRQGRTPAGQFVIRNKIKEPDWDSPRGNIPYGAPGHELGSRWLGISPVGETPRSLIGYGLHGTWAPETIGKASSNGCVRMSNDEVNELFDIVPYNTPVVIVD